MDKKNTGRNYCCFVCDQSFEEIDLLRSHIVINHKEGDDYVVCPVCTSPTRDLVAHYRSKHIGEIIPQGAQTRALIIRDIKKKGKKNKVTTKFKQGNFYSEKNKCNIFFRSGLELKFIKHLEQILITTHQHDLDKTFGLTVNKQNYQKMILVANTNKLKFFNSYFF